MNTKPKIIFFGTPAFVVPVLEALAEKKWLAGAVTAPDKPVGRKQILTPSPIAQAVRGPLPSGEEVPLLKPQKFNADVVAQLKKLQPDLFVVAAFGKILPSEILDIPKYGALNIHPSLLPKYRGPSPIQAAILHGDQFSGVSIIQLDNKMDHGPVLLTREIRLSEEDTFETLSIKMFEVGAELLVQIIPDLFEGKITPVGQNDAIASYCPIIKKEDGYFDIHNPPSEEKLDRMIRAYYPWPTAWTTWNSKIVKFMPENIVQMEGKKPIKLEDFLRGYPTFPIKDFYLPT